MVLDLHEILAGNCLFCWVSEWKHSKRTIAIDSAFVKFGRLVYARNLSAIYSLVSIVAKERELNLSGIEKPTMPKWLYLVAQAHPWKKQLFVKGRKLPAAAVWTGMIANDLSVQEAAENWDLPVGAVEEILDYCQTNRVLLEMEAQEELRILEEKGIGIVT